MEMKIKMKMKVKVVKGVSGDVWGDSGGFLERWLMECD